MTKKPKCKYCWDKKYFSIFSILRTLWIKNVNYQKLDYVDFPRCVKKETKQ